MRAPRSLLPSLFVLVVAGCATPLSELPYCASRLERGRTPTTACRATDEVRAYEERLAWTILERSQWEYPRRHPLRVRISQAGRVGEVCMGTAASPPGWSARDRVAASLPDMRQVEPAPECLAGTTLDLTGTLVAEATGTWLDEPYRMVRECADFAGTPPGWKCPDERPVCGIFRDGRYRTYRNHCEACARRGVRGFTPGSCPTRRDPTGG